jgi:hypothetical protein
MKPVDYQSAAKCAYTTKGLLISFLLGIACGCLFVWIISKVY